MLFNTSLLLIRKWQDDDANDLYELLTSDIFHFIDWKPIETLNQAKFILADWMNRYEDINSNEDEVAKKFCPSSKKQYAIILKDKSKVIGTIGIGDKVNDTIEVGYVLNSHYSGKGYTTEALVGMLEYLKTKAKKIIASTNKKNIASIRLMQKAGMVYQRDEANDIVYSIDTRLIKSHN